MRGSPSSRTTGPSPSFAQQPSFLRAAVSQLSPTERRRGRRWYRAISPRHSHDDDTTPSLPPWLRYSTTVITTPFTTTSTATLYNPTLHPTAPPSLSVTTFSGLTTETDVGITYGTLTHCGSHDIPLGPAWASCASSAPLASSASCSSAPTTAQASSPPGSLGQGPLTIPISTAVITSTLSNGSLATLSSTLFSTSLPSATSASIAPSSTPPTSPPAPAAQHGAQLTRGDIAGIAIGTTFGVFFIAFCLFYAWHRYGRSRLGAVNVQAGPEAREDGGRLDEFNNVGRHGAWGAGTGDMVQYRPGVVAGVDYSALVGVPPVWTSSHLTQDSEEEEVLADDSNGRANGNGNGNGNGDGGGRSGFDGPPSLPRRYRMRSSSGLALPLPSPSASVSYLDDPSSSRTSPSASSWSSSILQDVGILTSLPVGTDTSSLSASDLPQARASTPTLGSEEVSERRGSDGSSRSAPMRRGGGGAVSEQEDVLAGRNSWSENSMAGGGLSPPPRRSRSRASVTLHDSSSSSSSRADPDVIFVPSTPPGGGSGSGSGRGSLSSDGIGRGSAGRGSVSTEAGQSGSGRGSVSTDERWLLASSSLGHTSPAVPAAVAAPPSSPPKRPPTVQREERERGRSEWPTTPPRERQRKTPWSRIARGRAAAAPPSSPSPPSPPSHPSPAYRPSPSPSSTVPRHDAPGPFSLEPFQTGFGQGSLDLFTDAPSRRHPHGVEPGQFFSALLHRHPAHVRGGGTTGRRPGGGGEPYPLPPTAQRGASRLPTISSLSSLDDEDASARARAGGRAPIFSTPLDIDDHELAGFGGGGRGGSDSPGRYRFDDAVRTPTPAHSADVRTGDGDGDGSASRRASRASTSAASQPSRLSWLSGSGSPSASASRSQTTRSRSGSGDSDDGPVDGAVLEQEPEARRRPWSISEEDDPVPDPDPNVDRNGLRSDERQEHRDEPEPVPVLPPNVGNMGSFGRASASRSQASGGPHYSADDDDRSAPRAASGPTAGSGGRRTGRQTRDALPRWS